MGSMFKKEFIENFYFNLIEIFKQHPNCEYIEFNFKECKITGIDSNFKEVDLKSQHLEIILQHMKQCSYEIDSILIYRCDIMWDSWLSLKMRLKILADKFNAYLIFLMNFLGPIPR